MCPNTLGLRDDRSVLRFNDAFPTATGVRGIPRMVNIFDPLNTKA
jgi:hypothetical protein